MQPERKPMHRAGPNHRAEALKARRRLGHCDRDNPRPSRSLQDSIRARVPIDMAVRIDVHTRAA
jgi:hypothetical protein